MDIRSLLSTATGPDALSIFGTALLLLVITVVMKYLTKIFFFGPRSTASEKQKHAAHFDCLRVGIDLSILGLGTYLAVTQLALEKNIPVAVGALHHWNSSIILVQIILLIVAGIATALTDSSVKRFWSGILVPAGPGWISLCISAIVFYHLLGGG